MKRHDKEKETLRQIIKASDAIRQKHRILKEGKDTSERAMREVFKSIVTPLGKLVDRTHEILIQNEITEEMKQNDTLWQDAFETGEDEDKNVKDKSELAEASFRTIEDDDDDDDDGDDDENDEYDNNAKATMIQPDQLQDRYTAMLSMNRKRTSHGVCEV